MALSPSIPTSFVPKQPVQVNARPPKSGLNIFWIIALVLLIVALLGAGGVFAYQQYLVSVRDAKIAELDQAKESISASTVEDFIRLRDRFTASQAILDKHTAFTQFLDILEERTLANVRFDSLLFTTSLEAPPTLEMSGTARTFNALAAQSSVLNEERRIKRVIFSEITVNEDNTVSFNLSAELDPELLVMRAPQISAPPVEEAPVEEVAETPAASTTPATPPTP